MFKVGRKLTCGIVVANLPPSTLQNNTFIVCGKLTSGVILKFTPPRTFKTIRLIQHMKKVDMLSHCYRFIFRPPTKHFCSTYEPDLASWVMFEMSFPSPTGKQDVERTKLEPRVMFGIYAHWTIHSNTFNIWIKLTCWFFLLDLPALSPTKRYVQCMNQHGIFTYVKMFLAFPYNKYIEHMKKRNLESFLKFTVPRPYKTIRWKKRWKLTRRVFFYGESWHVELFLKFSPPRPYKANSWTSAENWHVGLFLQFITSRRLRKIQSNTCNIWTKLTCWVVVLQFECISLSQSPPIPFKTLRSTYQPIWNLESLLCFSWLSPTKKLRSTYKTTWHHEPCLRCLFLPLEIITLNIWRKWNVIILVFVNSFSYSKPICWTCEEH